MKYPWVAIVLIIIWFSSTYIVLKGGQSINVSYILLTAIVGTIIVSVIGFRPPKIK